MPHADTHTNPSQASACDSAGPEDRFVFVCAPGHSGSTLFDLVMGGHSAGVSLGEVTHLPKNIALAMDCGCGQAIADCSFWRTVIDDLNERLGIDAWRSPYDLNLGFIRASKVIDERHQTRLRMLERKLRYALDFVFRRRAWPVPSPVAAPMREAARNKVALYASALAHGAAVGRRRFVVDSSKHYLEGLYLHEADPERTRIVLLVRDGRAVFNSGLKQGFTREYSLDAWYNTLSRCIPLLEALPEDHWQIVYYERLATDAATEFARVCEFLGQTFEPDMLAYGEHCNHITNGNDMRFRENAAIRLDQSWMSELDPRDLAFFEARAGALNARLGYVGADSTAVLEAS